MSAGATVNQAPGADDEHNLPVAWLPEATIDARAVVRAIFHSKSLCVTVHVVSSSDVGQEQQDALSLSRALYEKHRPEDLQLLDARLRALADERRQRRPAHLCEGFGGMLVTSVATAREQLKEMQLIAYDARGLGLCFLFASLTGAIDVSATAAALRCEANVHDIVTEIGARRLTALFNAVAANAPHFRVPPLVAQRALAAGDNDGAFVRPVHDADADWAAQMCSAVIPDAAILVPGEKQAPSVGVISWLAPGRVAEGLRNLASKHDAAKSDRTFEFWESREIQALAAMVARNGGTFVVLSFYDEPTTDLVAAVEAVSADPPLTQPRGRVTELNISIYSETLRTGDLLDNEDVNLRVVMLVGQHYYTVATATPDRSFNLKLFNEQRDTGADFAERQWAAVASVQAGLERVRRQRERAALKRAKRTRPPPKINLLDEEEAEAARDQQQRLAQQEARAKAAREKSAKRRKFAGALEELAVDVASKLPDGASKKKPREMMSISTSEEDDADGANGAGKAGGGDKSSASGSASSSTSTSDDANLVATASNEAQCKAFDAFFLTESGKYSSKEDVSLALRRLGWQYGFPFLTRTSTRTRLELQCAAKVSAGAMRAWAATRAEHAGNVQRRAVFDRDDQRMTSAASDDDGEDEDVCGDDVDEEDDREDSPSIYANGELYQCPWRVVYARNSEDSVLWWLKHSELLAHQCTAQQRRLAPHAGISALQLALLVQKEKIEDMSFSNICAWLTARRIKFTPSTVTAAKAKMREQKHGTPLANMQCLASCLEQLTETFGDNFKSEIVYNDDVNKGQERNMIMGFMFTTPFYEQLIEHGLSMAMVDGSHTLQYGKRSGSTGTLMSVSVPLAGGGYLPVCVGWFAMSECYFSCHTFLQFARVKVWGGVYPDELSDGSVDISGPDSLVADRGTSLVPALDDELPGVEVRICGEHMISNARAAANSTGSETRKLITALLFAPNEVKFTELFTNLKEIYEPLHAYLAELEPRQYAGYAAAHPFFAVFRSNGVEQLWSMLKSTSVAHLPPGVALVKALVAKILALHARKRTELDAGAAREAAANDETKERVIQTRRLCGPRASVFTEAGNSSFMYAPVEVVGDNMQLKLAYGKVVCTITKTDGGVFVCSQCLPSTVTGTVCVHLVIVRDKLAGTPDRISLRSQFHSRLRMSEAVAALDTPNMPATPDATVKLLDTVSLTSLRVDATITVVAPLVAQAGKPEKLRTSASAQAALALEGGALAVAVDLQRATAAASRTTSTGRIMGRSEVPKGTHTCTSCGKPGHNDSTCPTEAVRRRLDAEAAGNAAAAAKKARKKSVCSKCKVEGHNAGNRKCPMYGK